MRSVRRAASLIGACGVLTLTSCAPPPTPTPGSLPALDDGGGTPVTSSHRGAQGSIIFTEAELVRAQRPLLDLLRQRLAGLQVRSTPTCPEVMLRGRASLVSSSSPGVYLDGLPASNTCILQDLNPADLARVEVYPNGIPARPGYHVHPYGLILIFARQAEDHP